jgi:hypothetical protein
MKKTSIKSATLAAALAAGSVNAYELKLGTNLPPVDVHGFVSQGLLYSSGYNYLGDTKDSTGKFFEAGANVSVNPFKRTRITAQGFMFNVGDDVGLYHPFLDYALVEYTFADWLGVRGGRIRRPSGIYNHIQDVDLARTWVLLPQGVYDARWRDFSAGLDGGEIFGNVPLSKLGSASYEIYAGNLTMSDDGGVAQVIRNNNPYSFNGIDDCFIIGGQLWWNTPADGLRFGVSGGYLDQWGYTIHANPVLAIHTVGNIPFVQASAEYTWRNWTFQGEYYTYVLNGHNYNNVGAPVDSFVGRAHSHPDSWYVSASYRFNKWLETGAYYSQYYADVDHRSGSADSSQKDTALTLRFDPKDWWLIKIEGHWIEGTALLQDNASNPNRHGNSWFMLAMKTTVSF